MRGDAVSDGALADIAYYPGCSLHGTSREFDESLRADRIDGVDEIKRIFEKCGVTP